VTPPAVPEFVDVNCDSRLTSVDSVLILEYAAGVSAPSIFGCPPVGSAGLGAAARTPQYRGDVDCNGRVDALDALTVLRAMLNEVSITGC
jgi:hypothetical protein